jgi:mono/diheme cytochrome c family protein
MSKRPFIVFGLFAVICVLVLPFIALGKEGDEDAGTVKVASQDLAAKDLFANNCGTCHTLAAAGTDGIVGPNLDQLLVPSGTNSAELYEGNASRVLNAVTCGIEGRMPRGILEEAEAREVAQFVAAYAGQIDKGPVVNTDDSPEPTPQPCQ